jgi:hypothetical protein
VIVLDEQLLGRGLEDEIGRWYRGSVKFIIDLRPNSVIKDDNVPHLLRQQNQPTFITINEKDFWPKIRADVRYCIVCFHLPDSQAHEIPLALQELCKHPAFNTKAKRMGKVIRVIQGEASYYSSSERMIHTIYLQ